VLAAGADSVAVIGALVTDGSVEENARALLRAAGAAAETRTSEDRAIAGKP
jgi:thiamine monophosphate synthase